MSFEKELHDLFLMQQAYATMFSLINKLQITGDNYLEGLTFRQYMTIIAILHLPEEETTINNIARKLGTSKQNANRMVASIEKLGYLSSFPSKKDKRATNVTLTESGKQKTIECSEKAIHFMADIFHEFNTSELESFWKMVKKLYCFDGNKQDGFEDTGREIINSPSEMQHFKSALETFSQKRNSK
ncbi:DNA-binding MarR family transcriptional regulator [Aequitasia blattaphilus]|uniref:MarR family transcriptional regulator n=1 Tax=Aequitasia blattaphilus TaxID=2949332 RepID=A0ABT1EBJ1_9FIRM|nr:MarR family transcriptional regulator [Aequitasia blattaphilus]MCP1103201.1 MarR family transcriptional regulator [Aequitasia blattaphilus]MCR8615841.1 MarR family transcriptional regulator [Aequitasia blattaphilus]